MGKIAKQFIGAIAISATLGAGTSFADASVVESSTNLSAVSDNTQVNASGTSTTILSDSISQNEVTVSTKTQANTNKSIQSESVQPINPSTPIASESSFTGASLPIANEVTASGTTSLLENGKPLNQNPGFGSTYWNASSNNFWGTPSDNQQPAQNPVLNASSNQGEPTPYDPLGVIINGFDFLSKATVPALFLPINFDSNDIFIYGLSAVFFSFIVLVLLNTRRYVFAQYIDRLKCSGYINAPRSDASVATYFATPLKWVLSSAPIRV